jgi:hypothetical protein
MLAAAYPPFRQEVGELLSFFAAFSIALKKRRWKGEDAQCVDVDREGHASRAQ